MNPVIMTLIASTATELNALLMKHISEQIDDITTLSEVARITEGLDAAIEVAGAAIK